MPRCPTIARAQLGPIASNESRTSVVEAAGSHDIVCHMPTEKLARVGAVSEPISS
jgi:hypothetical protein